MTVRSARPDEAAAISALAMRSKAHRGCDATFLEACRDELTWTPEQIEQQDVLVWEEGGGLLGTTARGAQRPTAASGRCSWTRRRTAAISAGR